jgi:hypothetical protein
MLQHIDDHNAAQAAANTPWPCKLTRLEQSAVCCKARADAVEAPTAAASLDPERGELQPASVSATTAPPAFVRLRGAENCCCSFSCSVAATLRAPPSCDAQACSSQNRNAAAGTPRHTPPMSPHRCVRYAATFPAALRTRVAWRVPARCKGKRDLPTWQGARI